MTMAGHPITALHQPPKTPIPPLPSLPLAEMPAVRKRKHSHFQSNTNIPAAWDDVVTRIEVTRSTNRRIHTMTTKVSTPATDVPSSSTPEALVPACELTFNNLCVPTPKKT